MSQDSRDVGAFYVAFEDKDEESFTSMKMSGRSVKAISIQALSSNYFVVLDTVGDVHLLSVSYSIQGVNNPGLMKRLTQTLKVLKLSVFHDASTGALSWFLLEILNLSTTIHNQAKFVLRSFDDLKMQTYYL